MEGKITRVHWRVAMVAGRVVQGACMGEDVEEGEKEGGIVTPHNGSSVRQAKSSSQSDIGVTRH
jgi:hypothetical protein